MKQKQLSKSEEAELRERRYNTIKMRITLMNVDALLRLIVLPWVLFVGTVATIYTISPTLHPFNTFIAWSIGCFFSHYIVVGMIRRMSDTYLTKLCAADENVKQCKTLGYYENAKNKPYRSEDDPLLTRLSFRITGMFGIPRRGLGHMLIALSHWLILFLYILNYCLYFRNYNANVAPASLFVLHLILTIAGVGMILKNASYLIKSRDILAIIRGVLDWRSAAERAVSSIAEVEANPEFAIKDSMEIFRFRDNQPPVSTCHTCVRHMAKHVAEEVPMVMVQNAQKAEILTNLIKLRKRSPQFVEALKELLERLKRNPENSEIEVDEFIAILRRTDELVDALYQLNREDPAPEEMLPHE